MMKDFMNHSKHFGEVLVVLLGKMKYLGYYSRIELIAGCFLVFIALLSIISTISTLWLIRDMKKWNGYLQIIFTLAVFQLVFDVQFILVPFFEDYTCNRITSFLNVFGGFAVMLWTNVISFLLYRIVKSLQSVNINDYYWGFFTVITIISFSYAVIENVYHYDYHNKTPDIVFNSFRAASVFFNFAIHGLISFKLSEMGYGRQENRIEKLSNDPVRVLSSRIKYYPIVQVITLSGAFWYLFRYGFNTSSYSEPNMSMAEQVSLVFYAISLPAAGLGYFIIFLLFQPQAYVHYKKRMWRFYQIYCCCVDRAHIRDDHRSGTLSTELNNSSILTTHVAENKESLLQDTDELDEDQLVQAIMKRYAPEELSDPQTSGSTRWEVNGNL